MKKKLHTGGKFLSFFSVALMGFPLADQFDQPVLWQKFNHTPVILIIAERNSAQAAKNWGIWIQKRFNAGYRSESSHLQALASEEKIKVVAVASLPDVPGIFKEFFRRGFRSESPQMGIALDFGHKLSKAVGFENENGIPRMALFNRNGDTVDQFPAPWGEPALEEKLQRSIQQAIDHDQKNKNASTDKVSLLHASDD